MSPVRATPRMPAEWESHIATWLAWPHNAQDWPGKFAAIPLVFAEVIRHLTRFERVELLVRHEADRRKAERMLSHAGADLSRVRFHLQATDRIWMRDSGCTFVRGPKGLEAVTWRFNAWAKYDNWAQDQHVGARMAKETGAPVRIPTVNGQRIVLEGGSIEVNGQGTLITTEECLLSPVQARNPGLDKAAYERVFAEHLGIRQTLWLDRGVEGDDTHGHVDDLTRFVAPDTLVTVTEADRRDPNHAILQENLARLRAARNLDGHPFRIVELPLPRPLVYRGVRLPASYGNFYIANGVVLVPVFNDPNDRQALQILQDCFPDREVVPIYCGDFIWGFGALHCMAQQQPAAAP